MTDDKGEFAAAHRRRRVVVTGMGVVCPLGDGLVDVWRALLAGESGVGAVTRFACDNFAVRIAGELRGFDVGEYFSPKEARHLDEFIQYGLAAGMQAVREAGLDNVGGGGGDVGGGAVNPERVGVAIGSGIGGLYTIERVHDVYNASGPRRISPFFIPSTIINMISGNLSIKYNFTGPNVSLVSACTTGAHNIGESYRMVAHGYADAMVCGGSEAAITPLGLGSFAAARALSSRNDAPAQASRPFDKGRDGFVLAEGAGVLVLEEYEHAMRRGVEAYAEVVGYGVNADAHHITAPIPDGAGAAKCMELALQDAGVNADEVGYINTHGTSTQLGDIAETKAIKSVFGKGGRVAAAISSTKSMTGHLLGAAGGIESIFSALAVQRGKIPPTINLDDPDDECDLDYTANTARDADVRLAISNSFGFGGTNASLLFRRM